MKIAIFADSFGHTHDDVRTSWLWPSWAELLSEKYGEENVYNFSLNGTGFWYSYQKFKLHGDSFDKIVFIISNTDRVWLNDPDIKPEWAQHISPEWTGGRWKNFVKEDMNYTLKSYLEHLDAYYSLFHSRLKEEELCRLATKELKEDLGNDILLLSCFQDELKFSDPGQVVELKWFMDEEERFWGIDYYGHEHLTYWDARQCHMAQENNQMLFKKVDKWIETGKFSLNKLDFKQPVRPWKDYAITWEKLKTMKNASRIVDDKSDCKGQK